jgi:anti-anti-sigma factor
LSRRESSAVVWVFPDCHKAASCKKFLRDLDRFLANKYQPRVIFDLSQVQTMNALGIDLLLQSVVRISNCDGELRLAGASTQSSLVLELTQLNQVLEVFPTVAEAMASIDTPGLHSKGPDSVQRAA